MNGRKTKSLKRIGIDLGLEYRDLKHGYKLSGRNLGAAVAYAVRSKNNRLIKDQEYFERLMSTMQPRKKVGYVRSAFNAVTKVVRRVLGGG